MGISTQIIIRKDVSLSQIKEVLENKFGEVTVFTTNCNDYFQLCFKDGNEGRQLSVFFGDVAFHDYKIDGILCSLGYWGNSKDICMFLLNNFGGYLRENDCDDKGFEPVNIELFEDSKELTPKDVFINKIISKVGYDKLKVTLELFDEYLELKK